MYDNLYSMTISDLKYLVAKTKDEVLLVAARKELAKRYWNIRSFKRTKQVG